MASDDIDPDPRTSSRHPAGVIAAVVGFLSGSADRGRDYTDIAIAFSHEENGVEIGLVAGVDGPLPGSIGDPPVDTLRS